MSGTHILAFYMVRMVTACVMLLSFAMPSGAFMSHAETKPAAETMSRNMLDHCNQQTEIETSEANMECCADASCECTWVCSSVVFTKAVNSNLTDLHDTYRPNLKTSRLSGLSISAPNPPPIS